MKRWLCSWLKIVSGFIVWIHFSIFFEEVVSISVSAASRNPKSFSGEDEWNQRCSHYYPDEADIYNAKCTNGKIICICSCKDGRPPTPACCPPEIPKSVKVDSTQEKEADKGKMLLEMDPNSCTLFPMYNCFDNVTQFCLDDATILKKNESAKFQYETGRRSVYLPDNCRVKRTITSSLCPTIPPPEVIQATGNIQNVISIKEEKYVCECSDIPPTTTTKPTTTSTTTPPPPKPEGHYLYYILYATGLATAAFISLLAIAIIIRRRKIGETSSPDTESLVEDNSREDDDHNLSTNNSQIEAEHFKTNSEEVVKNGMAGGRIQIFSPWKFMPNLVCTGDKNPIGEGGSGKVYKAVDQTDVLKTCYAVKCVNIRKILKLYRFPTNQSTTSDRLMIALKALLNEMQVLNDLHSEHVVGYGGCWAEEKDKSRNLLNQEGLVNYIKNFFEEPSHSSSTSTDLPMDHIFIKMEYCNFTLKEYLDEKNKRNQSLDILKILQISKDIVSGLKYVHSKGYIHRDLKPGNIFCKIGFKNEFIWKIGDFGLAVQLKKENIGNKGRGVGTDLYRSPEIINGNPYNMKTDLFSLGLVFVELIQQIGISFNKVECFDEIHKLAYNNGSRLQYLAEKITTGRYEEFSGIVNKLLCSDPDLRPSSEELQQLLQKNSNSTIKA